MIQVTKQAFLGQVPQLVEIHDVPGVGVDLTLDRQLQLVVVSVEIRIAALAEGGSVPFLGEPGIEQPVGGVEVHAASDGAAGHVS